MRNPDAGVQWMQYHVYIAPVPGILTIRENSGAFPVVFMKKVPFQPVYCIIG